MKIIEIPEIGGAKVKKVQITGLTERNGQNYYF